MCLENDWQVNTLNDLLTNRESWDVHLPVHVRVKRAPQKARTLLSVSKQSDRWRPIMLLFLTGIFSFLLGSVCALVCPHCCAFSIRVPLYTEQDMKTHILMFSQIEIHSQTHNRHSPNTHLLTNTGHVTTQAQMFPRDNCADLLTWMSAICHEDGWRFV